MDLKSHARALYKNSFPNTNVVQGAFDRKYSALETARIEKHLMRAEQQGKPNKTFEAEKRLHRAYGSVKPFMGK